MNSSICHECNYNITCKDPVVTCSAFCDGAIRYHAVCVGLSVQEGLACSNKNIFWVCNRCRNEFVSRRSRIHIKDYEEPSGKDIGFMKLEMKNMQTLLNSLVQRLETFSTSQPTVVLSNVHDDQPVAESSRLQTSSTIEPMMFTSTDIDRDAHKSLFISNIANDVSDDEVKEMVNKTVGANSVVSLKCLISPWKEKSSLDFISYKLVISQKDWNSGPHTYDWPTGIRCREFKDRMNSTWRPRHHAH